MGALTARDVAVLVTSVIIANATVSAVAATSVDDPTSAILLQSGCRNLADPLVRVACYDRTVDAFDQSKAEGDVVVVDRRQVREVRRQAFGLNLPALSLLPRSEKSDVITTSTLTVDHAVSSSDGRWSLTAKDGAVWMQIDNAILQRDPHKDSTLTITMGALGGYFCKVDGQPVMRCQRQR